MENRGSRLKAISCCNAECLQEALVGILNSGGLSGAIVTNFNLHSKSQDFTQVCHRHHLSQALLVIQHPSSESSLTHVNKILGWQANQMQGRSQSFSSMNQASLEVRSLTSRVMQISQSAPFEFLYPRRRDPLALVA